MEKFRIQIHSFQEVRDFVSLATVQPFPVLVGSTTRRVNGKSFMGMFTLDFSEPLDVCVESPVEEFQSFRKAAERFAVE